MAGVTVRRLLWVASVVLAAGSAVCLVLLDRRIERTGTNHFAFLRWNLFLAWVPFAAASLAHVCARVRALRLFTIALGAVWFFFLPNAPYLITDAIHLRQPAAIFPYDAYLIGAFSAVGVGLGLVSLRLVHDVVQRAFGTKVGWAFTIITSAATAAGIWIGRVLRWNSWDVLDAPGDRLRALVDGLEYVPVHARSIGLAAALAAAFLLTYVVLFAATRRA